MHLAAPAVYHGEIQRSLRKSKCPMSGKQTKTILTPVIPMLLIQVQYGLWGIFTPRFLRNTIFCLSCDNSYQPQILNVRSIYSYIWVVLGVHVGNYTSPSWASENHCCHHGSLRAGHLAWTFWVKPLSEWLCGVFTYICHKNQPNVGKYIIHGFYGVILVD